MVGAAQHEVQGGAELISLEKGRSWCLQLPRGRAQEVDPDSSWLSTKLGQEATATAAVRENSASREENLPAGGGAVLEQGPERSPWSHFIFDRTKPWQPALTPKRHLLEHGGGMRDPRRSLPPKPFCDLSCRERDFYIQLPICH